MKKKTRTFWTVVALMLVMEVATVLVVRYWYDIFPPRNVGILYKHYEDNKHIDASFVKGYRINDTLRLNVTVLVARDSIGIAQLWDDFTISIPIEHADSPLPGFMAWLAPRNAPWENIKPGNHQPDDYWISMENRSHTLYIFDIKTDDEYDAVQGRRLYEIFKDNDPEAEEWLDIPHQNRLKQKAQQNNKSSK